MTKPSTGLNEVGLSAGAGLGEIRVSLEAFFQLSYWVAEELEDLVANWSYAAALQAGRDRHLLPPATYGLYEDDGDSDFYAM